MGVILTDPAEYDGIRELLGVEAADVSNTVIELPPYLPSAELRVKRVEPAWAELLATDDGAVQLKTAAACYTAAALTTRMANRQRSGERVGEVFTAGTLNWDALRERLEAMAATALATLVAHDGDVRPGTLFTVDGISRHVRHHRLARVGSQG